MLGDTAALAIVLVVVVAASSLVASSAISSNKCIKLLLPEARSPIAPTLAVVDANAFWVLSDPPCPKMSLGDGTAAPRVVAVAVGVPSTKETAAAVFARTSSSVASEAIPPRMSIRTPFDIVAAVDAKPSVVVVPQVSFRSGDTCFEEVIACCEGK